MQNKRALLISLGVALFAVLMIYSYISQKEKTLLELATPIRVVVAIRDIPEGSKLDENVVEERQVPRKYVQPGAISELSMAVDKTVIVPVLKGTQILESVLMSAGGSLAAKVPTGMRAFSCAVTDVTAAAGLIRPGDFVDVMVTVETGHFQEGKTISDEIMTKTFLENVLVLAVNQTSSKVATIKSAADQQNAPGNIFSKTAQTQEQTINLRTITFALSPEDTQRMNLAHEIGSISVALRSSWDRDQRKNLPSLKAQDFLGIQRSVIPRSIPPWIEIRGAEQRTRY